MTRMLVDATFSGLPTWFEALGVIATQPIRGAAVVTLHHINVDEEMRSRAINIRYWSYRDKTNGDVAPSRRLAPAHTLNVNGMLATSTSLSPRPYLVAYSDLAALLVVEYQRSRSIRLIQYNPWTRSSTIHLLDTPPGLDLNTVSGVALDDHRGSVTLIDETGVLYSASYV
jgi:hypothetical protein